jgi:hypothetical protein
MTHTECYGDVTRVPVGAMAAAASFVEREWGDNYLIGYVGATNHEPSDSYVYVFQVKASDGSRFAVGSDRWGNAFELTGSLWLLFLQHHKIEAHVSDVEPVHPVADGVYAAR